MAARLDHLTGHGQPEGHWKRRSDTAVADAAQPGGDRVAVLMLDLDGFKQINDTLGHDKGDLVLQEIGRRLHANTFEYDTAARMGGDEFAVVLRRLRDVDDVAAVGHRLRDALVRPIDVDGVGRFIGVSVGAAVFREHGQTSAELVRAADAAMYQAKRGREGVRVYDAGTAVGADAAGPGRRAAARHRERRTRVGLPARVRARRPARSSAVEALSRWWRAGEVDIPPWSSSRSPSRPD